MTIVRVRVDCVVEFLLKLECRARDTEAQEAVYNFDYAGIETRRSRIPTAHISPILTLNTPLKIFLVSLVSFFFWNVSWLFGLLYSSTLQCFMLLISNNSRRRKSCLWKVVIFWVLGLLSVALYPLFRQVRSELYYLAWEDTPGPSVYISLRRCQHRRTTEVNPFFT